MTALLTDEEIIEAARSHAQEETKLMPDGCERDEHIEYAESDFEKGARFARAHYEAREKLWRELARLGSISDGCLYRSIELRLALGIDKEGA